MKKLKIIAVVVNYKTYEDLTKCLAAIEKQGGREKYTLQTIVVDSEYQVDKLVKIQKKYAKHQYILQDQSYGVSANFNKGFKKAIEQGADYILMVTPDVYLQKNVLSTLLSKMKANSKIGAITAKTLLPTTPRKIYFVGGKIDPVAYTTEHIGYGEVDKGQYDDLESTQFLNCAFVLIRANVFKKVGFWEPSYFLTYEDADWTIRVKNAGYQILVDKSVYAIHDESSTVGKKSMQQEYYMARNHLLFTQRNAPLKNKILTYAFVIKKSIELLPKLFRGNKQAYYILLGRKDFLLRRFGYKKIIN